MDASINITNVEKDEPDGLLVTFSDGTVAGYVVEELLVLRPLRESLNAYLRGAAPLIPAS